MSGRMWAIGSALLLTISTAGCARYTAPSSSLLVVSLSAGPNNLDPRIGTDDSSQKIHALIFDNLMELDANLRVVPRLAERLEHPDPLTYVATIRRGVRFHDGRELTAADVVFTFRCFLDPAFISAKKGGYRELASVDARDPYTVVFTLKQPFESFPINLFQPIVPAGSGADVRDHPIGTGPYRFVRHEQDEVVELAAFDGYFLGRPRNDGLLLKVVPDEVMRGLELRKGTMDVVINDVSPDIAFQLEHDPHLSVTQGPGVDFQYIGVNLRDRALGDLRVRQALAHAIDRRAIIEHLRRGLATPGDTMLPPLSWARANDVPVFPFDPSRARALLDEAGYPDPDGDGPAPRLTLTYKTTSTEFFRLQAAVIQEDLRRVGVALEVRSSEFATLYADVLAGNFQLYSLQWTAGSLADPDILRRVFHSQQAPPAGFNRGRFADLEADRLLDAAAASTDPAERLELFRQAQRRIASQLPYIGLWTKTNIVIAQRNLTGVKITPLADFLFLKDVARVRGATTD